MVVVVAGVAMFFLSKDPAIPVASYSPFPVRTTTPTQSVIPSIEGLFSVFSTIPLSPGQEIFQQLASKVDKVALATQEPGLYKLINPQDSSIYSFRDFIDASLLAIPEEVSTALDIQTFYLSLMQKPNGDFSYALIVRVTDGSRINSNLNIWETRMPYDLQALFSLDTSRAALANFLDNTYQGTSIRYRNFPNPLETIDYAVVMATNGSQYLLLTSSRDHIYKLIDNLKK